MKRVFIGLICFGLLVTLFKLVMPISQPGAGSTGSVFNPMTAPLNAGGQDITNIGNISVTSPNATFAGNTYDMTISSGWFVVSSTSAEQGLQNFILNETSFTINSCRIYTSGNTQSLGDIVADIVGYYNGQNTLIGTLKIPTGSTSSSVVLSTWVASKDMGLKFIITSNTSTVKVNQINWNVKYSQKRGQ